MQVELQLSINHSLITLPVGLPGYEYYPPPGQSEDVHLGGCVALSVPEIEVQLRSHNLGFEMNLNTGTIYGAVESEYAERSIFSRPQRSPSSEVMLIEGYCSACGSRPMLTFSQELIFLQIGYSGLSRLLLLTCACGRSTSVP
jgi:hypothetical protein